MTNRMGVALCVCLLGLFSLSVACGGDDKKETSGSGGDDAGSTTGDIDLTPTADAGACDPDNLPELPDTGIGYPDAHCGPDGCHDGACDPFGRCAPACNAWTLQGKLSFQAVTMAKGTPAPQAPVTGKDGDDVCPANMVTPPGVDINCCQRGDNTATDSPALKLTSLTMTRPVYFASPAVAMVNKGAIESDWYNWVTVLGSAEDGELTATSGNAVPHKDGTFASVKGPFKLSGIDFNPDGLWDAQTDIPASLATEGDVRTLTVGPTSSVKDYVMTMWLDGQYNFARLELHMRGLKWVLPLDKDLTCAGERLPGGQFDPVGTIQGYVPLDAAITTEVFLAPGNSLNLCTSMTGAKSCKGPVSSWKTP